MAAQPDNYHYAHPHPALTVDAVVLTYVENHVKILLIKRAEEPYKDRWAFPGGFVEENEKVEDAVNRELFEETGLTGIYLKQFYTASAPGRDPRGWTISVIFYGCISSKHSDLRSGSDAQEAEWHRITDIPPLAFDHDDIMQRALHLVRMETMHSVAGPELLPDVFTREDILTCYEQITCSKKDSEKLLKRLIEKKVIDSSGGIKKLSFVKEKVNRIRHYGFYNLEE